MSYKKYHNDSNFMTINWSEQTIRTDFIAREENGDEKYPFTKAPPAKNLKIF